MQVVKNWFRGLGHTGAYLRAPSNPTLFFYQMHDLLYPRVHIWVVECPQKSIVSSADRYFFGGSVFKAADSLWSPIILCSIMEHIGDRFETSQTHLFINGR